MQLQQNLTTPILNQETKSSADKQISSNDVQGSVIDNKLNPNSNHIDKKRDHLSLLIGGRNELLPKEFKNLEQIKDSFNIDKEPTINFNEGGWIGPSGQVTCIQVTSDDKYLISGDSNGCINVFDLETKKHFYRFVNVNKDTTKRINSLMISTDNQYLVYVVEKTIEYYDLTKKQRVFALEDAHEDLICAVIISKENKFLVSGSNDRSIRIFDVSMGKELYKFDNIHQGPVTSIALSKDGKYIVSGSADKSIKILDFHTKYQIHHFENIHQHGINSVIISEDDKYIISASNSIRILSLETKQELHHFKNEFENNDIKAITLSKNKNGIIVADNRSIRFLSFQTKEELFLQNIEEEDPILSIAALNNKNFIITGSSGRIIRIFDLDKKEETFSFANAQQDMILGIALSNDDRYLVSGANNGSVCIFDFIERKKIHTIQTIQNNPIISVVISSNNKFTVSGAYNGSIEVFDLEKKEKVSTFAQKSPVFSVAISNNERMIISGGVDCSLRIFDVMKQEEVNNLENIHAGPITSVCFTKDDAYIITASDDCSIKIIDCDTKQTVHHFNEVNKDSIVRVTVSHDNKYIISCSLDNTIKVFSLETKLIVHDFQNAHTTFPLSISMTKDSKYLISSSDTSIKIWSMETFQELHEYKISLFGNFIMDITVSSDNQYIIACLTDGSIRIFRLQTKLEEAKSLISDLDLNESICSVCVSKNEKNIGVQTQSKIYVFDFLTKKQKFVLDAPDRHLLNLSNDGRYLIYLVEKKITVFDLKQNKENFTIEISDKHSDYKGLGISNCNKFIISWTAEIIKIYEMETKEKVCEIIHKKDFADMNLSCLCEGIQSVVISNDNKYVIFGLNKDIRIYDLHTSAEVYAFKNAHRDEVTSIIPSSDGKCIFSTSQEGYVKMYDIQTKQEALYLEYTSERGKNSEMLVSRDNRYIVIKRFGKNKVRILDINLRKQIQEFSVDNNNGSLLHFSSDNKYIIILNKEDDGANQIKVYSTIFASTNFVSTKISASLPFINYAALLLTLEDIETRNQFLLSYHDLYAYSHNWTTLHILAIFQPSYILQIPKYTDFKVPFLVDKYGKTPLHYLLAHNNVDYMIVNIMLEYILDFLGDKGQASSYENQILTDSLSNLFLFIVSKSPPRLSHKYLELCYPQTSTQHGDSLPTFGDSNQRYTLTNIPVMNLKVRAEIYAEGDDRIIFRTNMIKLDYQVDSDDMIMTTHVLSGIEDGQMFKLPIIEKLIDHLWESTKSIIISTAIFFSILMILLSVYIGLDQRSLLMESAITILTLVFVALEVIQFGTFKEDFLKSIWNWIDMGVLGLIITFMFLRFINNQSFLTQSWMSTAIIILGYLRWISFLRLFAPTRHLIEVILVVVYDMMGFMTIIGSILVGFSLIFLQFNRKQEESQEYSIHFYKTYQLMFGNYDDSEYSLSQIILTSSLLLILNVILLNLLISIIGDSYGKVQEKKELIDALSRLDIIQEAIVLIKKLNRRKASEKGYLIYCLPATVEDENPESIEWRARMNEIKSLFLQTETEVKTKVEQEVNQVKSKIDKIDEMEDRMKNKIETEIGQVRGKMEEEIGDMKKKMNRIEEEVGQVRMEMKALGELVTNNFIELTRTLKANSSIA